MFNHPRFKRQVIEVTKYGPLVVCDNPNCTFEVLPEPSEKSFQARMEELEAYINQPCVLCGENLLTQKDFDMYKTTHKLINWVNKYFSWTVWFVSEKKWAQRTTVRAHIHNKLKLTVEEK